MVKPEPTILYNCSSLKIKYVLKMHVVMAGCELISRKMFNDSETLL